MQQANNQLIKHKKQHIQTQQTTKHKILPKVMILRSVISSNQPHYSLKTITHMTLVSPIPAPSHFPKILSMPQNTSKNVAVIGAGSAGLVTARELKREGHTVVIFERENQLGGTWVYTPDTESDPIGLDPNRNIIHSSLYSSLRVNLPREVMGFRDYPFVAKRKSGSDPRRYPGHKEVLDYLNDFAVEFGVLEVVRFGMEVGYVGVLENGKWKVSARKRGNDDVYDNEEYDAVVICNGHYTEPRIADIPGIEVWPGKQIHSHNYRDPEPFRDQVVVLIGGAASATDISREIAEVAKEVHISSRSATSGVPMKLPGYDNIWLHNMIEGVDSDGGVSFRDGSKVLAEIILHCTGYKYHFPFLESNGMVTVDDNRVGPLYKHIFPPAFAPSLSFVGLPWKVIPFCLCELQSKWIAGVLSGRISLPSKEDMNADIEALYSSMEAAGIPKRYTHNMDDCQFDYDDWLAAECGCTLSEEWRKQMYFISRKNRKTQPETYRDQWDDDDLIIQAHEDFVKYIPELARAQKLPR
ncbi:flavin-containing monooxygenase FMO GS-OX-like 4 [Lycium barbarum]|uniref:flavin-containing monooxygenase FMO GS-OX-like 4 n=1 Tax=Lycium barbarum TaxID=112863 RepID=UPI00293F0391|nr:flavin-containing monooxygenase FMO GS-OX-like 4 [Lycium barbarum]